VTGRILRYALGAAGLAAMAFGAVTLLTDPGVRDWRGVVRWLVLALLLHDAVLAPATVLLGLLMGARWRARLRRPFLVAGALTAVALPVLLRPRPTANPSVLPLDYTRGWAVSVGVAVGVAVGAAVCWDAARRVLRSRGPSGSRGRGGDRGDRGDRGPRA
jgi:MFS family permease